MVVLEKRLLVGLLMRKILNLTDLIKTGNFGKLGYIDYNWKKRKKTLFG